MKIRNKKTSILYKVIFITFITLAGLIYSFNIKPELDVLKQVDENYNKINTFPAKKYNLPDKYHKKWKANPRKIYLYEHSGEIIWGFTAFILRDTSKKLKYLLKDI